METAESPPILIRKENASLRHIMAAETTEKGQPFSRVRRKPILDPNPSRHLAHQYFCMLRYYLSRKMMPQIGRW